MRPEGLKKGEDPGVEGKRRLLEPEFFVQKVLGGMACETNFRMLRTSLIHHSVDAHVAIMTEGELEMLANRIRTIVETEKLKIPYLLEGKTRHATLQDIGDILAGLDEVDRIRQHDFSKPPMVSDL